VERLEGEPFFWLGREPATVVLQTTCLGHVTLSALFVPGPSLPSESQRHLSLETDAGVHETITVMSGSQTVTLPVAAGTTRVVLTALDAPTVQHVPGVIKVVVRNNFVGVVAEKQWQAEQAVQRLRVVWNPGPGLPAQKDFYDYLRKQPSRQEMLVNSSDVDNKLKSASRVLKAAYFHPYQAHGSIGSSCAVADVQAHELPDDFYLLAEKFWPGPLTKIVRAAPRLPLKVTANSGNIAVRLPDSAVAQAVVRALKCPITATAANLAGAAECTTAKAVADQMGERVHVVLDGGTTPRTVPTTIVNLTGNGGWVLQREGAIPAAEIEDVLGDQ
jgi:tRNA A37 threonylcarbamoyladenosine synthetase subunit TsaC/SUA5/YrdC